MCFAETIKSSRKAEDEEDEEMDDESDLQLMGVDEAIIHSIEKCGMYSVKLFNFYFKM